MVLPIIAGAAAGTAGGLLGSWFLGGGTKKEIVQHAPYETYAPTDARVFNVQYPDYQVQIQSPGASQTTKKEQSATQDIRPSVAPVGGGTTQGTDMTKLAMIGAVALVAYGLVSKK